MSKLVKAVVKEVAVDSSGKAFVTVSGLARLAGVDKSNVSRWYDNLGVAQKLESAIESSGLPLRKNEVFILDSIATTYIAQQASKGNKKAIQTLGALATIGLRFTIQQAVGWQPPAQPETPPPLLPRRAKKVEYYSGHENQNRENRTWVSAMGYCERDLTKAHALLMQLVEQGYIDVTYKPIKKAYYHRKPYDQPNIRATEFGSVIFNAEWLDELVEQGEVKL